MGRVIDFYTAREVCPAPSPDLWHINRSGEVCCADCETVCPYRLQNSPAEHGRRQADCTLGTAINGSTEEDIHA